MPQIALPSLEAVVTLNPCQVPPPEPVLTTVAPVRERQPLYLSARDCLYAVNAADGTVRWCQQVKLIRTREVAYHPLVSSPPPPRLNFGAPRVVGDVLGGRSVSGENGVVYICIYGFGAYTCAFDADDGSLRWWTPTDATVISMPFLDFAVPLVHAGVVYSGTYALNAQDGAVRWRIAIDTLEEGALALHALVDETLYASTTRGISAINAHDGQIRWRYQPDTYTTMSGPPAVADGLLYAGTRGGVGYPDLGHFFALDGETGTEVWRHPHPMGSYIGAVVEHGTIYVSSGDRFLYALDAKSGVLRWQHQFATSGYYPATIAHDVLYTAADGAYALRSADGAVLWHYPLESSPSVSFSQPIVLDGAVYLVRMDKRARGALYALDARTGAECWHTPYPFGGAQLAAQ